jgi:hypothetical protein
MGARATIRIIHPTSTTPIHFYTHWKGNRIAHILAAGILKADEEGRLTDYQYATRMIFDVLTGLEGGSTGYGICIGDEGQPGDVEYPTPTIEWLGGDTKPFVSYGVHTYGAVEFARRVVSDDIPSLVGQNPR